MAGNTAAGTADYGIDDPLGVRRWFSRAGWTAAAALVVWLINQQEYSGPSAMLLAVGILLALLFAGIGWYKRQSSVQGKLALRDRLLDSLALKGDERVIEIGCGKGLLSIGAAKRLTSGKVIAVDTWDPHMVSGNTPEAAKENAKAEGVGDKVRFETNDGRKLPYPDANFDVALSNMALHRLEDHNQRRQAMKEMLRLLKPAGRLLIHDTGDTDFYAQSLRKLGAQDVTVSGIEWLWLIPSRTISARKP